MLLTIFLVPVIAKFMGKDPVVDIPKACYGKHILPVPSPFVINMDALLERGWNSGGSRGEGVPPNF